LGTSISALVVVDFNQVSDRAITSNGFLLINRRRLSILGSKLLTFKWHTLSPLVRHSLTSKLKGPGLVSTSPDKHISIAAREKFQKNLIEQDKMLEQASCSATEYYICTDEDVHFHIEHFAILCGVRLIVFKPWPFDNLKNRGNRFGEK
jgi:hypothetical protein